ncbi:hypothetical protein DL96DRAFT_1820811 [Flagelloscypha sp. PMI_526]|nr:hypothetical protein DL96DRAFT_1820811 [Flagelloscypha sp. PMI_526]
MSHNVPPAYVNPPEYSEASSSTQRRHDTQSPSDYSYSNSLPSSGTSLPSPSPRSNTILQRGRNNINFRALDLCTLSSNLRKAVQNRQDDILRLYFANGIPVDTYNCQGNTVLFLAIRAGDIRLTRFLLKHRANPSRWSSGLDSQPMQSGHDPRHALRMFFLDVASDEADLKPRVMKYQKKNKPEGNYQLDKFYERIDVLYSARTPLMEAASIGNLAIVKLLIEQHGVNPLLVAPDGQTAFRLARDNGHTVVADYLPATSIGGMRRIQNRSRTTVRRLEQIGTAILLYLVMGAAFFVQSLAAHFRVHKFFIWTLPKSIVKIMYQRLIDAETMKQFSYFILWEVPKFVLWYLPKFLFWELPKALPSILIGLSKLIWEVVSVDIPRVFMYFSRRIWRVLSVDIPRAVKYLSLWTWQVLSVDIPRVLRYFSRRIWRVLSVDIPRAVKYLCLWTWEALSVHIPHFLTSTALITWHLTKMVGLKLGHAVQAIVSVVHTAILAIISFLRSVTLKDIWNGVVVIFEILFIDIPLLLWQGLKGVWKIFDQMMHRIFHVLWFLAKFLVLDVLLFIPGQLWKGLVEVGGWIGNVGREILLAINPKW